MSMTKTKHVPQITDENQLLSELSVQQATEILGSSEVYLRNLLDFGEIEFREEGEQCFIRLDDLLNYKQQKKQLREKILDEMACEAQEMGLYGLRIR